MTRIVAIGGGGFMMEDGASLLDDYVVGLAAAHRPRVCFLATASGDADDAIERYYRAFGRYRAQLSHLAFFRKPRPGAIALAELEPALAEQDLIYVGGGNTRSMLAVWREWGVPQALRKAAANGALLAGISAGAICWFEWGASDSAAPSARSAPLRCLGFIKGSCCPHWGGESHRRREFHAMVRGGALPPGYGVSDGAAVLFEGGRVVEAVAAAAGAGAYRVDCTRDRVTETMLAMRPLAPSAAAAGRCGS